MPLFSSFFSLLFLLLLLIVFIDYADAFSIDKRANPWFMRPAWRSAQKKAYYVPGNTAYWPSYE